MNKRRLVVALVLAVVVVLSNSIVGLSFANNAQLHGVISLTFDDGWQNQYNYAFPLMQARGMVGTFYVITSQLSTNLTGSTCMSFAELQTMQTQGCEIGSHSVDHPDFTTLTDSQIIYECQYSKSTLQSYGLVVNNFAYPSGSYNAHTDSIVSQYYRSGREASNTAIVLQLPYSQFPLPADTGDIGDPGLLSSLESMVDKVYSTNEWAVIYFHQILPNVPNTPEVINTQTFTSFLDYIKSKGVSTLTVEQALNLTTPPGAVAINPTSVRIDIGQSDTFSSSVSGSNQDYSYQWYLNGSAVSGATKSSWTFVSSSAGNYVVYLNVTDPLNNQVQSNIVRDITVYPQPTVSINPSSVIMITGKSQMFNSIVSGGTPPYNYQWYLNGTATSVATNANYAFTPPVTGTYNIYVSVIDSSGVTAESNYSTVKVGTPTNIAIKPANVRIDVGQSQAFNSTIVGGTAPYAYQWFLNGSAVSGANGATWVFSPSSTGDFMVWLNVTDAFNLVAQSNIVTDVLVYSQLAVSISPASVNMIINADQQFNSTVTGGLLPYAYQWYYANGTAISGATTSNLAYRGSATGTCSVYLNVTDSLNNRTQSNTATIDISSSETPSPTPATQPDPILQPTSTPGDQSTSPSATSTSDAKADPSFVVGYFAVVALMVSIIVVITVVVLIKRKLRLPPPPPPPSY